MANVDELVWEVALHAGDPSYSELSEQHLLALVRSAAYDARNSGWLLPHEEDESLTVTENTYEYAVPLDFAYIEKMYLEETINSTDIYIEPVPSNHWELRLNGAIPVIYFNTLSAVTIGKNLKIVGQKRPTLYHIRDQIIDRGMESFLRERALYYAFRILGAGMSELARWRQTMSQQSWATSEAFLRRHPQEFRVNPNSRHVPGR